jgi:hypothetical protein
MTRWEYLTVQLDYYGLKNDKVGVRYLNGQELRDWKKLSLEQFLNQLGNNGWEAVTGLPTYGGVLNLLLFKRPSP